jgi:hypothetical protein
MRRAVHLGRMGRWEKREKIGGESEGKRVPGRAREYQEDLGIDTRKILKLILRK